jgi:hypothetical protein
MPAIQATTSRILRRLGAGATAMATALLVLATLQVDTRAAARDHARTARIPCRSGAGTFTIAHNSRARIFGDSNGNDYACLYSAGRARYLSPSEHYGYRLVRFAGSYVAFTQTIRSADDHIGEMNMRTGHLRNFEIASPIDNSTCPGAASLVLKSDGALAWIGTNFKASYCVNPPGPLIEVHRHDSRGLMILDNRATIQLHSLRLTGSLLQWIDAGHTRSASLL